VWSFTPVHTTKVQREKSSEQKRSKVKSKAVACPSIIMNHFNGRKNRQYIAKDDIYCHGKHVMTEMIFSKRKARNKK